MAKNKTTDTGKNVSAFLSGFVTSRQKGHDSHELIRTIRNITGLEPRMWGHP